MSVWKLASILFVMTSVVFAGIGVLVIISIPALYDSGMRFIPAVVVAGFILASIASMMIAKRIIGSARA